MEKKEQESADLDLRKEWYKQASEMTMEKLPQFINHLLNDYSHNYNTIAYAITAGAIATAKAMDRSNKGGITGFQAGAIMWEFITQWQSLEGPLRLLKYEEMLFPQMEYKFKTIDKETWEWLQKRAKEILNERGLMAGEVKKHLESVVNGNVPFGFTISEQ